ncbi:hypothetical protein IEQ44_02965 [Nocardioides sp. Y6]|uniref:Nuclear transport factor 2 family protein n=1 Tax=Nocardioides malaquae TaxID=2773426 RepID=A0ABR9RQZ8_9ACTN|nr:hypothetical protein [Nocardioides malaquae]MBE7323612.1 hypothetical protein [Nocardioides malaquae]
MGPSGHFRGRRRAGVALVTTALLLAGAAGCTDGEPETEEGAEAPEPTSQAPTVETRASVGEVAGRLPRPARRTAVRDVVEVVDGWIDDAHVGGEWPRAIGAEAYDGFTPAAARAAEQDAALTSAAEISEQVDSVAVKRRVVRVDLVGARGRAVGATARVVLTYETQSGEGEGETQTVRVRGRLLLTPTKQGWKVFGHDLTEETR